MRHPIVKFPGNFNYVGFFNMHWHHAIHGPLAFLPPLKSWLPRLGLNLCLSGQYLSTVPGQPLSRLTPTKYVVQRRFTANLLRKQCFILGGKKECIPVTPDIIPCASGFQYSSLLLLEDKWATLSEGHHHHPQTKLHTKVRLGPPILHYHLDRNVTSPPAQLSNKFCK